MHYRFLSILCAFDPLNVQVSYLRAATVIFFTLRIKRFFSQELNGLIPYLKISIKSKAQLFKNSNPS